jgi:hypothetical protein
MKVCLDWETPVTAAVLLLRDTICQKLPTAPKSGGAQLLSYYGSCIYLTLSCCISCVTRRRSLESSLLTLLFAISVES